MREDPALDTQAPEGTAREKGPARGQTNIVQFPEFAGFGGK